MAKTEADKKANRWWRRIPRQRAAKRNSDSYYNGFAWAMTAYYLEKKPLEEVEAFASGFPNETLSFFDRGALQALSILKTHKMLGVLQQMEST